jgi:hypothetical protein
MTALAEQQGLDESGHLVKELCNHGDNDTRRFVLLGVTGGTLKGGYGA